MLEQLDYLLVTSVFANTTASSMTTISFLGASVAALILGLIIGISCMYRRSVSKGYVLAVALLPIIVEVVIILVNGNLGVGIAVLGAFSLIRFRSMPGSALDIATVFEAMAVGLACGMGFIGLAVILTVIVTCFLLIYQYFPIGEKRGTKHLSITIPEDIDYEHAFDDVLNKYGTWREIGVETTNMGSLYKVSYELNLNKDAKEKELIDELRCINGNLKVALGTGEGVHLL